MKTIASKKWVPIVAEELRNRLGKEGFHRFMLETFRPPDRPSDENQRGPIPVHELITEIPFLVTDGDQPSLTPLPKVSTTQNVQSSVQGNEATARHMQQMKLKLHELHRGIRERDDLIRQLKSGGVGTARSLPPPDAEALLEAFHERYFETRFKIRELQIQLDKIAAKNTPLQTNQETHRLQREMAMLESKMRSWLRKISSLIEAYQKEAGVG